MTLKEKIMKLQTYKMFEGEDTVYVERDDILELLEKEPCEDAVSRQAVLDLCDSKDLEYKVTHFKEDVECLSSVYPKQNTWIPVSERLPEEFESVLVCYKSQGGIAQAVTERFGTHTGYKWSALAGIEPIAWMPLPAPFEPQESEDKE